MASMSQQMPLPAIVAQVEALAVRRATEFALELGITEAIFEGDSETICRELNDDTPSRTLHGHLLQDVKSCQLLFNLLVFRMYAVKEILSPMLWQDGLLGSKI